jgi:hypothetical protein
VISSAYTPTGGIAAPVAGAAALGVIVYPDQAPFYLLSTPSNYPPSVTTPVVNAPGGYVPDLTSNPLHGFESFRVPNQAYVTSTTGPPANFFPPTFLPQQLGGAPTDENFQYSTTAGMTNPGVGAPTLYPTYSQTVNATVHSDGLNEADELNLYQQSPLLDSPFGPTDLEWLYRSQDIDGAALSSRLAQLAPISFTNTIDGLRRRKLFALDSWELNNFVWANDNPGGTFPNNRSFTQGQSASFVNLGANRSSAMNTIITPTPALAHKDKKINLNYPLPVSNDPNEPIRQKWISDTYYMLKAILPPQAVDTPEELAQLSQYVINIIDFRDPDCTMTHWVNPDVMISGVSPAGALPLPTTPPTLLASVNPLPVGAIQLDQYGMEYNPVALNELLAYSYLRYNNGANARVNRFFCELVNTQTSPELAGTVTPNWNPALGLGGTVNPTYQNDPVTGKPDPYACGTWDVVFTGDDAYSRPDPYRGQLLPFGNAYGLTPLRSSSFSASASGTVSDVQLTPLGQASMVPVPAAPYTTGDYFYAIGNQDPDPNSAFDNDPAVGTIWHNYQTAAAASNYTASTVAPTLFQSLLPAVDPINGTNIAVTNATPSPVVIYQGVLPSVPAAAALQTAADPNPSTATNPPNYVPCVPAFPTTTIGGSTYFWACLRRPANPFAPVSLTNPMVVVDSMRFPYIEATAPITTTGPVGGPPMVPSLTNLTSTSTTTPPTQTAPTVINPPVSTTGGPTPATVPVPYSAQRFQPYRGGHAVPNPAVAGSLDSRYGYTDQIVVPSFYGLGTVGVYYMASATAGATTTYTIYPATNPIYHTIGWANEYEQGSLGPAPPPGSTADPWNFFVFNDRDFTSVAELMLVPGSPPGLFTKQFVEYAPSWANVTNIFSTVVPQTAPPYTGLPGAAGGLMAYVSASATLGVSAMGTRQPESYPYLIDKFFYTAYGQANTLDTGRQVGGYGSDGWFKMFEFFEVPSQMMAAYGPVAAGVNFDWSRQDVKPGLLNLNLIMDEEVFFSVAGRQTITQSKGQYQEFVNSGMPPMLTPFNQFPSDQFTQSLLNFDQVFAWPATPAGVATSVQPIAYPAPLPAGTVPVPLVVSETTGFGAPNSAYPVQSPLFGSVLAADPVYNSFIGSAAVMMALPAVPPPPQYTNALKAAWVQFLSLRHGGSGYLFGFGNGAVSQNVSVLSAPNATPPIPGYNYNVNAVGGFTALPMERPFHSLSYPDIDYTVMRPAALPPSPFTTLVPSPPPNPMLPYANNPSTYTTNLAMGTFYTGDPGVRNYWMFSGYPTGNYPGTSLPAGGAYWPVYPPAVPPRRLFQIPDAYDPNPGAVPIATAATASNASETGDPTINVMATFPNPAVGAPFPTPAPGALPPITISNGLAVTSAVSLTNSVVNLFWPLGTAPTPGGGAGSPAGSAYVYSATLGPATPVTAPVTNEYYGSRGAADYRQHPYYRSEQIQKVMNQTTVRTHQYAVWITVGFFQVLKQGDLGMLVYDPRLAFDILGPELGAANGKNTRFRSFYLVDRLQLTGFNPMSPSSFRAAVVYKNRIE